jgi:hypothetical protein
MEFNFKYQYQEFFAVGKSNVNHRLIETDKARPNSNRNA